MGLPGAGKTTAAKIIAKLTGGVQLSSDDARLMIWNIPEFTEAEHLQLYEYLNDQTLQLLRAGRTVVYDANLNRYAHRKEKYDLAGQLQINCRLVWIQTPPKLAKERRVEENITQLLPEGETAAEMFDRIEKVLEEPRSDEPTVILDGTQITAEYVADKLQLDDAAGS